LKNHLENSLKNRIDSLGNASRINRLKTAKYVLNNPSEFERLIALTFTPTYEYHHKAAWVLEFVLEKQINWLVPHLSHFTEKIHLLKNESAIRPVAKICKWVSNEYVVKKNAVYIEAITKTHLERLVACVFDWLIDDRKVATQAYSMDTLYNLGRLKTAETDWIHPALQAVIQKNMLVKSKAYKARGKIVLQKIQRQLEH